MNYLIYLNSNRSLMNNTLANLISFLKSPCLQETYTPIKPKTFSLYWF